MHGHGLKNRENCVSSIFLYVLKNLSDSHLQAPCDGLRDI